MNMNGLWRHTQHLQRILCGILFLILFSMAALPAHALTSGTTTSGSITPGGSQTYNFSGAAGEGIMLYAYASYNVKIKVYKPDSSVWADSSYRVTGTLPDTGTYTVEVYGNLSSSSGPFDLYYLRGGDSVSSGSLTSGQVESSSLDNNAIDSYQFTGTAGEGIMLYGSASYSVKIRVYKPDGSYWIDSANRVVMTLPDTGTYTVAVYANLVSNSGDYNLYYLRGGDSVSSGPLTSGLDKSAFLDSNAIHSYQFTGTAGEGVMLHGSASYSVKIRVYKPDGSYWIDSANRVMTTLPDTGTYTVAIYGNLTSNSGDYNLYYFRGGDSVSQGTLVSTSQRSADLPRNGLDSYKFTGSASNSLSVNTTASFTRRMRLYRPDGSYWTGGWSNLSVTLPETGEYTLVIYGNLLSGYGPYTVTVTTPPAPMAASDPSKSGCNTVNICQPGAAPSEFVGNPINFDLGYKTQTERDYQGGLLSLTRVYRSDSTWTDNTFGERWRHNYARTLDISGSAAAITDGTGATTHYTEVSGNWVADDSDITATFEEITGGYVYTLPENTREIYDSNRRLVRIEYIGGGAVDLDYDGSGNLETVSDENARTLTFSYSSGRVASVVTPEGTFNYDYDGAGNLIEVEKPDAATREYHYEDTNFDHALTGITDENAVRYATWEYDAQGRAILSKLAGDVESFEITWNMDDSVTTTNPLGKEITYYFTHINGLRRIV